MARVLIPNETVDLNGDGRITIDELARSTFLVFAQLVIVLSALIGGVWLVVIGSVIVDVFGSIIATSAAMAFSLGIYRMLRFERLEKRERKDWELQRKRAKWELEQAQGVSEQAKSIDATQAMIDAAALQILSRYYANSDWSREGMEHDGIISAELWNQANAMLKKRGIRRGRKRELEPDDFASAWALYCEGKLRANQHRMAGANDDWLEVA